MTVKEFFSLLESAGYLVNVDLYFGDDCEGATTMTADELLAKYANKKMLGFDVGQISIAIEE